MSADVIVCRNCGGTKDPDAHVFKLKQCKC